MNWPLMLLLASMGILYGLAAVFGVTGWVEWLLWAVGGGVSGVQIAMNVAERRFAHGFIVGALGGFADGALRMIFFSTYSFHNPDLVKAFHEVGALGAVPLLLIQTTGICIFLGIFFGIAAVVAGRYYSPPDDGGPPPPDQVDKDHKTEEHPGSRESSS